VRLGVVPHPYLQSAQRKKMIFSLAYPLRLLLAVLTLLAAYLLGTNIAWALRVPRPGRFGQAIEFIRRWGRRLWLGEPLRLAYYLLLPYLILYQGWVTLLDLGLADLDWIQGLGLTVALGSGSLLLLALLWRQHAQLVGSASPLPQARWLKQPLGWAFVLREAILLEAWWALCRSPMLLLAGPYFGVYLGLLVIYGVGLLNARTRYELGQPGQREGIVLTASIALVTATLYLFTRNLWLCILLHFVLRLVLLQILRSARPAKAPACQIPAT
jgi:hypothetical protein